MGAVVIPHLLKIREGAGPCGPGDAPRPVLCVVILALIPPEGVLGQRITTDAHSRRKGVPRFAMFCARL
jgi:hypothetical protein